MAKQTDPLDGVEGVPPPLTLKRPDNMTDLEWALVQAGKSFELAAAIIAVGRGEREPSADEAATMLEVAKAAEMRAFKAIRKLQTQYAPKLAALSDQYHSLSAQSAQLFHHATK